jgi:hypothetical protein
MDCSSTGNGLAPARHGPGVTVDMCAAAPSPATKPFWGTDENVLKQKAAHTAGINKRGSDHVGPHPQRDLQAIPQGRASRHGERGGIAMTETVAALFVFLSVSVFLAHAFDAYRMR